MDVGPSRTIPRDLNSLTLNVYGPNLGLIPFTPRTRPLVPMIQTFSLEITALLMMLMVFLLDDRLFKIVIDPLVDGYWVHFHLV